MVTQKIINNEELLKEIKLLHKEIEELKNKPVQIQFIPQPYPVYQTVPHICPPPIVQPWVPISPCISYGTYNLQNAVIGGTLIG